MMIIPELEKSGRQREFRDYSIEKTDEIVYRYLFEGLSTRKLDSLVLEKDPGKSEGWQSHSVLKYYGLSTGFKGLFKGMDPEEAMSAIPDDNPACALIDVIGRHADIYSSYSPAVVGGEYKLNVQPGKEKLALRCIRANQYQFRDAVMDVYNGTCCITGVKNPKLLIASHIRPWSRSSPTEKTDSCNGLCLNRMHDAAFDAGLMTVDADSFKVRYSHEIQDSMPDDTFNSFFRKYEDKRIMMPADGFEPGGDYLQYHNHEVFGKRNGIFISESELIIDALL